MLTLSYIKDNFVYYYEVTLLEDNHSKYNTIMGTTKDIYAASKRSGHRLDRLPLLKLFFQAQGDVACAEDGQTEKEIMADYIAFLSQFNYQLVQTFPVSLLTDFLQALEPTNLRIAKDLSSFVKNLQNDTQGYNEWNQIYLQQTNKEFLDKEQVKKYRKDTL